MVESPTQGSRNGENNNFNINEKIHINYRLQYLKDTVLAKSIEDTSLNCINSLVMTNYRKIIEFFVNEGDGQSFLQIGIGRKSMKDVIYEKIRNGKDIKEKQVAIEFMIELC